MSTFLSLGSEKRPLLRFQAADTSNYTALLLSRDGGTLYVGAREALFALNISVSFLPGGGYQEVRGGAWGWRGWAAGGTGEGDGRTGLWGLRRMQTGGRGRPRAP